MPGAKLDLSWSTIYCSLYLKCNFCFVWLVAKEQTSSREVSGLIQVSEVDEWFLFSPHKTERDEHFSCLFCCFLLFSLSYDSLVVSNSSGLAEGLRRGGWSHDDERRKRDVFRKRARQDSVCHLHCWVRATKLRQTFCKALQYASNLKTKIPTFTNKWISPFARNVCLFTAKSHLKRVINMLNTSSGPTMQHPINDSVTDWILLLRFVADHQSQIDRGLVVEILLSLCVCLWERHPNHIAFL